MPTYVYHCDQCNNNFEAVQRFSDNPLTACPHGHSAVRRVITASAIIFKGSGWYINDSKATTSAAKPAATKSTDEGASADAKSESKNDSGGDAKSDSKSDTKSESKPETKSDPKPPASTEAA